MYVPQAHVQNYVHNNDNSPQKVKLYVILWFTIFQVFC